MRAFSLLDAFGAGSRSSTTPTSRASPGRDRSGSNALGKLILAEQFHEPIETDADQLPLCFAGPLFSSAKAPGGIAGGVEFWRIRSSTSSRCLNFSGDLTFLEG